MQIAEEALNVAPVLDQHVVVGAATPCELLPGVGAEKADACAGARYAHCPLQSRRNAQERAPCAVRVVCGLRGPLLQKRGWVDRDGEIEAVQNPLEQTFLRSNSDRGPEGLPLHSGV